MNKDKQPRQSLLLEASANSQAEARKVIMNALERQRKQINPGSFKSKRAQKLK